MKKIIEIGISFKEKFHEVKNYPSKNISTHCVVLVAKAKTQTTSGRSGY